LQSYLQKAHWATTLNAKKRAREFVQYVAVGSGLLLIEVIHGRERWRWWHATVRDYLAALAISEGARADHLASLLKWENSIWQEIIIFMISILSVKHRRDPNRHPDVTDLFQYLLDNNSMCGLLLYISLADGAAVDEKMEQFVIEQLVRAATRLGQHPECEDYDQELGRKGRSPVELLSKLSDRPAALIGLKNIKNDLSVGQWMREKVEEVLRHFDEVQPLRSQDVKPTLSSHRYSGHQE